jgi:quercetin dioxygenase-like cupin family protein
MQRTAATIRLAAVLAAVAPACDSAAVPRHGAAARATLIQPLPVLDGAGLEASLVEVGYAPGDSSVPHTHPCAVIGYVVSGALRSRVNDAPESTYRAGQSFYEAPNSRHLVSANASQREPVRFLAFFVCDRKLPLSVPLQAAEPERQP